MQAVLNQIMETSYGPINGPAASMPIPEPDLLDNGKVPDSTRRPSQDSFREYAQRHLSRPTTVLGPNGGGMGGLGSASANAARVRQRRNTAHYSKRMRRRLVYKNGEVNITQTNIRKRRRRYLADIFTTLVDIKWRYNLMLFALAFTLSWLIFALVWWLVCFSHGDLDVKNKNRVAGSEEFKPCVLEIHSFTSALLFSIETQHTIGYGSRHTTEECPEAIVLMMFQSCFGVICQALMTGIVFAKLSRPKKRAETLMFSKNACICKQDGDLCLLLRVGDMRKSQIVEAHIRAVLIKKKITKEGDVLPLYQFDVDLGFDEGRDRLFLVWPVIIVHKIDEESPFWELSPEDFLREQFELIVILEGIVESTGMTTQARSSYLPGEVLWGHRFERLVTFQKENGQYQIDFSRFHNTIPVDTPNCSAKELAEMTAAGQTPEQTFSGTCGVPAVDEDDEEDDDDDDDDDEDDDDLDEDDDDDDDEENLSLGSKFERYHQLNRSQHHYQRRIIKPSSQTMRNGPYVVKRHGAAQTVAFGGVEDFESLPSKQSTCSDLRGSQEMSETLL